MKDIYKNPILYYILAPVVLVLWPLLARSVYLPDAERSLEKEQIYYDQAQKTITKILIFDPDRLKLTDTEKGTAEFNYAEVVDRIASSCAIPPTNCDINTGIIISSGGQKSRNATVTLKDVDITKFAGFLSKIQLRWANLQCERVKLTKKKGLPDTWNIDLTFKYYY